ncbi:phospholipase-like protein, partial [Tanacetum coccineum]
QDGPKTFTKQTSSSFFDMAQRTPTYPNTFEDPIPSRHPTSYPGTSHIMTPMTLQGFAPWSSTNQARPLQNLGSPYITTPMAQQGFAPWSSTNQARPSQNPNSPHIATPMAQQGFAPWSSINQAGPLQNPDVGGVNPVVRNKYVNCMTFLESPKSVFLDCFIKGFVVEVQFWLDLVPYVCKGALYTENNIDCFGWLSEDHINCWMELMIRARPPSARYTVAKTRTSAMLDKSNKFVIETDFHLMGMLDGSSHPYPSWNDVDIVYMPINCGSNHWKAGHFERTGRRPYKFELFYNQGLDFVIPQQGNTSDCGVVMCWVIENLCRGQAPLLYQADPNEFFSAIRVQMCLMLYDCRCEDTLECGYD